MLGRREVEEEDGGAAAVRLRLDSAAEAGLETRCGGIAVTGEVGRLVLDAAAEAGLDMRCRGIAGIGGLSMSMDASSWLARRASFDFLRRIRQVLSFFFMRRCAGDG
jgi:hypothetical protein